MIKIDIKEAKDPKNFNEYDMFQYIQEIDRELFSDPVEFRLRRKIRQISQKICHRNLYTKNLQSELKKIKSNIYERDERKYDRNSGLTIAEKKRLLSNKMCEKVKCKGCHRMVRKGYMSQHVKKGIHQRGMAKLAE